MEKTRGWKGASMLKDGEEGNPVWMEFLQEVSGRERVPTVS